MNRNPIVLASKNKLSFSPGFHFGEPFHLTKIGLASSPDTSDDKTTDNDSSVSSLPFNIGDTSLNLCLVDKICDVIAPRGDELISNRKLALAVVSFSNCFTNRS